MLVNRIDGIALIQPREEEGIRMMDALPAKKHSRLRSEDTPFGDKRQDIRRVKFLKVPLSGVQPQVLLLRKKHSD